MKLTLEEKLSVHRLLDKELGKTLCKDSAKALIAKERFKVIFDVLDALGVESISVVEERKNRNGK